MALSVVRRKRKGYPPKEIKINSKKVPDIEITL